MPNPANPHPHAHVHQHAYNHPYPYRHASVFPGCMYPHVHPHPYTHPNGNNHGYSYIHPITHPGPNWDRYLNAIWSIMSLGAKLHSYPNRIASIYPAHCYPRRDKHFRAAGVRGPTVS